MTNKQINESFLPSIPNGEVPKVKPMVPIQVLLNVSNAPFPKGQLTQDIPDGNFSIDGIVRRVHIVASELQFDESVDTGWLNVNASPE